MSRSSENPHIAVLLYHRVDTESDRRWRPFCVAPEHFAEQMRWLADQGFSTIHLGQLLDHYHHGMPLPAKPMVITFDDGYFCNYSRAFPILRQHGFVATVFLVHNFVRYDAPVPKEGRHSFLSWPEILEMQEAGWEFHSHGLDHRQMTDLSGEALALEIGESKKLLATRLNRRVDFFCYPFARFNRTIQDAVRSYGYRGACGGTQFDGGGAVDDFAVGRTEILWGDSLRQFIFKVHHGLNYYFYAKKMLGQFKRQLLRNTGIRDD